MTRREVCRLSCRLLGIYAFMNFVAFLNLPLSTYQIGMLNHDSRPVWLAALVIPVCFLLLSFLLWFGGDALSARIASGPDASENKSVLTPEIIQRIAFAVAGILILAGAMSPFGRLIQLVFRPAPAPRPPIDEWNLVVSSAEVLLRLALGAWLLLGSERLSRLLQKAKPLVQKDW